MKFLIALYILGWIFAGITFWHTKECFTPKYFKASDIIIIPTAYAIRYLIFQPCLYIGCTGALIAIGIAGLKDDLIRIINPKGGV